MVKKSNLIRIFLLKITCHQAVERLWSSYFLAVVKQNNLGNQVDVKLSSSFLFRSSHRVATNLLSQAVRIICSATITSTSTINYINTLWFGIVLRQGHVKRVSETSMCQWVSYWKGHEMQWWDSGLMQIPQFSQVHSMHALYLRCFHFKKHFLLCNSST